MKRICFYLIGCVLATLIISCKKKSSQGSSSISFTELSSSKTGIDFQNTITENDSVNLIANEYSYIGSGVGIGDFNNDNLPDIFFGANQESCKLYLNKTNLEFEDITKQAGLETNIWTTGVSIVDINNDGFDDIYLCASGSKSAQKRKNKLYINNKNLTFTEKADEYGLGNTDFSTQAVFFDYDKDGDLDVYLLNHLLYVDNRIVIAKPDLSGKALAADKLYRNEGIPVGKNHPVFTDVSALSGIKEDGYGLGVVVSDVNNDNWPDIYVANDYVRNDVLWLNNQDGTFSNRISTAIRHQSYSSMGVDAADINNDARPDIASLDMLPESNEAKKMMYSFLTNERYELERRNGNDPQFMRNMLQLNNGTRVLEGKTEPFFSEIGQMAGIQETDWSWSVLMADFNNDGWKDMHITNGYGRDMLNNDFIAFRASSTYQYSTNVSEQKKKLVEKLAEFGNVELKNYLFQNNGDLTFKNVSAEAGIETESLSNGCAYADLDGDGDLDLVVNNINKKAFILRNNVRENLNDTTANFIKIKLAGPALNKAGVGAKIFLHTANKQQYFEQNPVRGYASTVDKLIQAGIGNEKVVDSIRIVWPDNQEQLLIGIKANSTVRLDQKNAQVVTPRKSKESYLFTDITAAKNISFKHSESFFHDYQFQLLLPQKYSQLGPFISSGDVNNDGLTDFFVGGAYNQSGSFFIQQANSSFTKKDLVNGPKDEEDLGSALFDADGDKDLDLFVNSGGYEYDAGSPYYIPRLYKNDGKGNFTIDRNAIPKNINTSAQTVASADFDYDGDTDLFIGGRISPNQYPLSPQSYILINEKGVFTDATAAVCAELKEAGMVTSALWTDIDKDKKVDLVIAGEWMPIKIYRNVGGKLINISEDSGIENLNGQWRSLSAADLDKDGDIDFVAGNLGLNNKYKASPETPIKLFVKDIDNNGIIDPIPAYYLTNRNNERKLFPDIGRDLFAQQVPLIKKKYLLHKEYSDKTIPEIFNDDDKLGMVELTCNETSSCWLENKGNGKFEKHLLPMLAQFAPTNSILCIDINKDGNFDILTAGNEYQTNVGIGRYDASYGLALLGDGKGNFTPLNPSSAGFILDGDVKDMKLITTAKKEIILVAAINDSPLKALKLNLN